MKFALDIGSYAALAQRPPPAALGIAPQTGCHPFPLVSVLGMTGKVPMLDS